MKKLKLAALTVLITQILPLIGKPELIFHYKNLVIIAGNVCIWLFHPAVSGKETSENKNYDRYSVLLIISMSLISTIIPVLDWAYFSNPNESNTLETFIGFIFICLGVGLRNYSIHILGRHFTPTIQLQKDHELITEGPYSIIRHPSYTGALMALVGGALWLNSSIGIISAIIAMMLAYTIRINAEEKVLKGLFGNVYSDYQKNTKRIIPFVW
jgi:protein-S-isoprenylcysteine O-methyltransferase Ste14